MSDPFALETSEKVREFLISESAREQLLFLFSKEESPGVMLRVKVSGGGCSGYQYGYDFERTIGEDDMVFGDDDVKVIVDNVSMDLLSGSEIDYVTDMIGSSFQIKNPNADSSCGCGASFSI
ncbi:MAG: iron-sulfur cluster insertion protein ErpA [Alphaproteobacteria bacterium]|nr:iron-sulfur cluster insertion protein ErpA [Alphaproteobacteria bacterium]